MKGIYLANAASACCYFFVAVTGYSAYGNTVDDDVLASRPRASKGWIALANLMVLSFFLCLLFFVVVDACVDLFTASSTAVLRFSLMQRCMQVWFHVLASYQVFSHPIFDAVEIALISKIPKISSKQLLLRGICRSIYVIVVTFVAAILPFFADLMGLIGAIGFIPMTFIMPNVRTVRTLLWLSDHIILVSDSSTSDATISWLLCWLELS